MDYQSWIEGIDGLASLYSFDILPDGSFSELRLMAVNKQNEIMLHMRPDAPEFYPGIPYRNYWMDLNFENFAYKCASTSSPLYSYVNARGRWLKGFYLPISNIWDEDCLSEAPEGSRRVFCLYVISFSDEVETDSLADRSPEIANAVLNIGIKLHETQDFYQSMADASAQIRECCGAEKSAIYTVDMDRQECSFIDETGTRNEFMEVFGNSMGRTPFEVAMAWEKDLAQSDCLLMDDLRVIEERDPEWYKSLCTYEIKNIILYAIRYGQTLVGFIWAANYDVSRTDRIKETLELSTFLLAAVIKNHHLMSTLEFKSTVDPLTQAGNRNAMDEYISGLAQRKEGMPESIAVIFADLNGLKKVNDEEGHDAGDKLLMRAASLLKLVFGDNPIYRIGGDEFVILCPDVTEEKMNEQVSQLKGMADNTSDVSFAVGSVHCQGTYDLNVAIQAADERMYQDKKAYYERG
ncbi:GGDEF domain-containing protein [Butyrivibrio sp. XPD2002]|uniref:GGDEF domain-containing protein n=1 Tax=Butyrivibrio sp. XPD2002 TaxID=1280665 RepID=UPI0003FA5185|nr:GGDEF domain-containing protein [Butyrivibrio sp. XPD2002]